MLCVDTKWQLLSVCCCCKSVCLGKISEVAWDKMHFTWFSRRDGFSPTRHQFVPSTLRGSRQDMPYGELVGENSICPGNPCEIHIISYENGCHIHLYVTNTRFEPQSAIWRQIRTVLNIETRPRPWSARNSYM